MRALTGASGAILDRANYRPFGEQQGFAAVTESKGFIGQRHDDETGLMYLHARYYDPVLARFIQADPMDPTKAQVGVNRFAYAGNNPVIYLDPTGLHYGSEREPDFGDHPVQSVGMHGKADHAREKRDYYRSVARELYKIGLYKDANNILQTRDYFGALVDQSEVEVFDDLGYESARAWREWADAYADQEALRDEYGNHISGAEYAAAALGVLADKGIKKVTVGRWMSQAEYDAMLKTGKVVESVTGTTHVLNPAKPESFIKQARPGSLYVEFDVPIDSLKSTQTGWAKIIGPNSLEGRLAVKKGFPAPQMPNATNIIHKATIIPNLR